MTSANIFTDAHIKSGGHVRGADDVGHHLFKITQSTGQVLYGNYTYAFAENENDFDIEIGLFGYLDPYAAGDLDPAYRQHFTAEESSTVERLIRSYFLSNSFDHGFLPPAKFLGGVSFRPNWIVQKSPGGTA